MFNHRPSRQRAYQQSRFMRSKPTKRHFFQSFTTQRPARRRLHVHSSPIQEVSSSKTVVRITLGLLLLHVVIIGGVLIHENMGKSTQAAPDFSKKPDATGPGELDSAPAANASPSNTQQPALNVPPSDIAAARDATYQGKQQEVLPPSPSDVAISTIPPADPANPDASTTEGTESPELIEVVAEIDPSVPGNTQDPALLPTTTTPRAIISAHSNASAQQRRQAARGSYKSSAGESWQHVAAKHNISVTALKQANPEMLHYESLYPGAVLVIPSSTPPPQPPPFRPGGGSTAAAAGVDPVIKMDPTQGDIYIDPVELILDTNLENKGEQAEGNTAGSTAQTPPTADTGGTSTREVVAEVDKPAPARDGTSVYSIRRGDTLSRIAKRHGMTLNALLKLNNIPKSRAGRIKPGQKVKVITKKRR